MVGMAALQGPHQVAQKSSSTTLPLSEASETLLPSRLVRLKLGAASPTFTASCGGGAAAPPSMMKPGISGSAFVKPSGTFGVKTAASIVGFTFRPSTVMVGPGPPPPMTMPSSASAGRPSMLSEVVCCRGRPSARAMAKVSVAVTMGVVSAAWAAGATTGFLLSSPSFSRAITTVPIPSCIWRTTLITSQSSPSICLAPTSVIEIGSASPPLTPPDSRKTGSHSGYMRMAIIASIACSAPPSLKVFRAPSMRSTRPSWITSRDSLFGPSSRSTRMESDGIGGSPPAGASAGALASSKRTVNRVLPSMPAGTMGFAFGSSETIVSSAVNTNDFAAFVAATALS